MATPQAGTARGMSRGISRDLGLQQGPQQGISDLPPDFNYSQIESMVRELRTAAALEVTCKLTLIASNVIISTCIIIVIMGDDNNNNSSHSRNHG